MDSGQLYSQSYFTGGSSWSVNGTRFYNRFTYAGTLTDSSLLVTYCTFVPESTTATGFSESVKIYGSATISGTSTFLLDNNEIGASDTANGLYISETSFTTLDPDLVISNNNIYCSASTSLASCWAVRLECPRVTYTSTNVIGRGGFLWRPSMSDSASGPVVETRAPSKTTRPHNHIVNSHGAPSSEVRQKRKFQHVTVLDDDSEVGQLGRTCGFDL